MNKRILILISFLATYALSIAQDGCYTYFPNTIGNEWSYSSYNRRGRLTHSTLHALKVANTGGLTVQSISFDKDGEPLGIKDSNGEINVLEVDYEVFCFDNGLYMQPASATHSYMELFEGLEAEIIGDDFLISHADMDNATTLPNYGFKIKVHAANLKIDINVTGRKVLGDETIETPAGTFQCLKLEQYTSTRMAFINKNYRSEIWVAQGIGLVKSVTYRRNGNILTTKQLEYKNW